MIQFRYGTFETNSSSSHSIIMMDLETFNKWKNGELLMSTGGTFYPVDKAELDAFMKTAEVRQNKQARIYPWYKAWDDMSPEEQKEAALRLYQRENCKWTYKGYINDCQEGFEYSECSYTTKSGEVVMAVGLGGYNG